MKTSEIKQISEAQARDMLSGNVIDFSVNRIIDDWRSAGYIEQTAEERFEEFARGIQFDWATNFSIYREKLVSLARAAIRERDKIIKSLREASEGKWKLKLKTDLQAM